MKQIGIIQFAQVGYPTSSPAVEYEVYIDGDNKGWKTVIITKEQKSYISRLPGEKKSQYILNHFEN